MNITLSINQEYSIEIGYEELADFLVFSSDNPSSADFYNALSSHPSSQIRSVVASKTCLPFPTLVRLATDPCVEVVQRVLSNATALKFFSADLFKTMIARDVSIALEMAKYHLDDVDPAVSKILLAVLLKHGDPAVCDALCVDPFGALDEVDLSD